MALKPTPELHTERLVLTPLRVADANEMVRVLADAELYMFTGGNPPGLDDLEKRYQAQVEGLSTDREVWHNWIIRLQEPPTAVGFVQATIVSDTADVAWVVGADWQRKGFASEAATTVREWLETQGVRQFSAHIHPGHEASGRVALAIGLNATSEIDGDREVVWRSGNH
ncbi:MAG: GNAT family N-acetyltransferase [Acidimicrobiia bacterium]|nr:GNAT family N-acetyltransferase [Acidimicrobiia bacterium]MDQ3501529.1 GNAT family N-acetyltransferase [Actinomycetota bacterium]